MSDPPRQAPARSRSNFATKSAFDGASELNRRWSLHQATPSPKDEADHPLLGDHGRRTAGFFSNFVSLGSKQGSSKDAPSQSPSGMRRRRHARKSSKSSHSKAALDAKPQEGSKLGTFAGVFVPTTLNVLSILMFLRFGFILGQGGIVGMMGMLIACYAINLLTTMSISAIATNGTVRGGGAYYLISRSLGPEFGGSIGIVFYLGFVFNTGMNAVGLIDCFIENFGSDSGNWYHWMPQGFWWEYLWATVILLACTMICLAGSGIFSRCSNGLLVVLLVATFSIPFSALLQRPFASPKLGIEFTGVSWETFKGNLMPRFTKGAAGSDLKGRETWQDLFGILFPATGGIFAGASMSGDLKHPSKAIPKGTLYGLGLTFISYTVVALAMAASITRGSFHRNTNVIQLVNLSEVVVLMGEFATSFFSTLMGVIGSAKLLQALARDKVVPGLSIFGQGTKGADEPIYAIFVTYAVAQLVMLSNINQIASFVTMTYLMTFLITNLACFLLKVSSAPNFRPSFHYFNWFTAAVGAVVSGATMFFVDELYASACVALLILIFLIIHYTTPPKLWGDVSQSLIYHQVRKYLLRLRGEHVKFWRPQILLFINDPRRQFKLIQFCNSLKKGALFIIGHVIVTQDFAGAVPEAKRQQTAWTKYIDFSKIKAFINIAISPGIEWGTRNVVLSAGLGGMRPNIVVMGFYNLNELRTSYPLIDVPSPQPSRPATSSGTPEEQGPKDKGKSKKKPTQEDKLKGQLPTDAIRKESAVNPQSYVTILEDLLLRLQVNVAIAKGFQDLEFPAPKPTALEKGLAALRFWETEEKENTKRYIDLWPIQMSAEIAAGTDDHSSRRNVTTTNFDTYTLILQLGCILNTVPSWKRAYRLRVAVFVEYESDVEEERGRVTALLSNLRIQAEVLVFWLASGDLKTYEIIINANTDECNKEALKDVNEALEDEEWWDDVQKLRGRQDSVSAVQQLAEIEGLLDNASNWPSTAFQHGRGQQLSESREKRFADLRKMLRTSRRKTSMTSLRQLGVNLGMRTHRLPADLASGYGSSYSDSDDDDEEAIETDEDSAGSVVSEGDADEYASSDDEAARAPARRARSLSASEAAPPAAGAAAAAKKSVLRRITNVLNPITAASSAHGSKSTDALPSTAIPPVESSPHLSPSSSPVSAPAAGAGTGARKSSVSPSPLRHQLDQQKQQPKNQDQQHQPHQLPTRPPVMRHQSLPKFTSKPVPRTRVAADDGPGPSIMFADAEHPGGSPQRETPSGQQQGQGQQAEPKESIYTRSGGGAGAGGQATGFPAAQAVPLSFNDLPCRAQHLILNELMRGVSRGTIRDDGSGSRATSAASTPAETRAGSPARGGRAAAEAETGAGAGVSGRGENESGREAGAEAEGAEGASGDGDTAVILTTLPSPVEGTCADEADSVRYLADLEVLCQDLPPVLLVHSNSLTVTTNL
ncbi:uncharacterized protein K452DRAFT_318393 [Aplosporella prunicola CBS 121167]|uniref:Amino acid permease/ SLC12A domain-containing protein n=1 Tax=Aplosporella prunicola CBS 121167 TaxID=1176127 RepID=A0A6A6BFJ8_9PEZI|nr:uncharacterized protein K452DRAFT_318393 [Aplosporella prunicola CBS 121167]KAF2142085.1 hypothetical protein K452DRAFT_318393 [Aplosporella prunicola CBS 121167]